MGQSSICKLPPPVQKEVNDALGRGDTLRQVVERLEAQGHRISRSALDRYRRKREKLEVVHENVAALMGRFDLQEESGKDRLIVQLTEALVMQALEQEAPDARNLSVLTRCVRDLSQIKAAYEKLVKDRQAPGEEGSGRMVMVMPKQPKDSEAWAEKYLRDPQVPKGG